MLKVIIGLFVFLFYTPTPAQAWGALGHHVICDVTWRTVHSSIRNELLQAANRMGYKTFAHSCTWADRMRKEKSYHWTGSLHYINVSRSAKSVLGSRCERKRSKKPRCVLTAIPYYYQRWLDTSLTRQARDEALLFLAHFVGDIHQPLHVSYADDRGGTQKMLVFGGKLMSLHRLWDTDILHCGTQASWRSLGKQLYRSSRSKQGSKQGDANLSAMPWADESLAITRHLYAHAPQYLPDGYCRQYHPIAMDRLLKAGVRLAALLEQGSSALAYNDNSKGSDSRSSDSRSSDGEGSDDEGRGDKGSDDEGRGDKGRGDKGRGDKGSTDKGRHSGEPDVDEVQSAPNLIRQFSDLWKLILTLRL